MGRDSSERVRRMKGAFMVLHEEGYTIPEIAKKFDLDFSTVYHHLGSIAADNGVTRESLLQIVQTPRSEAQWNNERKKVRVDLAKMDEGFNTLIQTIDNLQEDITATILEEEQER